MKIIMIVAVVVVVAVMSMGSLVASPVPEDRSDRSGQDILPREVDSVPTPVQEVRSERHPRATCDLLSFTSKWISVNHSACAAHCLAMGKGFKGGFCKDAVCNCRK